jgi:hypothetical protein
MLVTSTVAPTLDETEDTKESDVSADSRFSEYEVDDSEVVSESGAFTVNATFQVYDARSARRTKRRAAASETTVKSLRYPSSISSEFAIALLSNILSALVGAAVAVIASDTATEKVSAVVGNSVGE